jgi:hypothetical protein
VINSRLITDQQIIANEFCRDLESTFQTDITKYDPFDEVKFFKHVKTEEIFEMIDHAEFNYNLKNTNKKSSPGHDGITIPMIINSPRNVKDSIINLFNFSLSNSMIPDKWKTAKIIMIPKPGKDKTDVKSFRPISLLSNMSKLLEKIINTRLTSILESNKLISIHQSGFRKNRSTKDHILRLIQDIKSNFNQNKLTGAVLFDVSKAFDQTWHTGILYKMTKLNIPAYLISWVENFLDDRKFFIQLACHVSMYATIKSGVPQGSTISPTLFGIYISDIDRLELSETVNIALYADDICIWYSSKHKKDITTALQKAIDYIVNYFKRWCLKINISKTAYTVFTTAGCRKSYNRLYSLNLFIENEPLLLDPFPKLLGINFDPKLSFHKHFKQIQQRAMSKISILRILKSKIGYHNNKFLINVYKTLVRSIFDYSDIIIATANPTSAQIVQKVQNIFLRICCNAPLLTSTTALHEQARVETIQTRSLSLSKKYLRKAYASNDLIKKLYDNYLLDKDRLEGSNILGRSPTKTPLSLIIT